MKRMRDDKTLNRVRVRVSLLLTVSQSVRLGFMPQFGTHGHIFAFERKLRCYVSMGALPDGWAVLSYRESQSLSVLFSYIYIYVFNDCVFTQFIFQEYHFGHCAADFTKNYYLLWQFRLLNCHTSDRHNI